MGLGLQLPYALQGLEQLIAQRKAEQMAAMQQAEALRKQQMEEAFKERELTVREGGLTLDQRKQTVAEAAAAKPTMRFLSPGMQMVDEATGQIRAAAPFAPKTPPRPIAFGNRLLDPESLKTLATKPAESSSGYGEPLVQVQQPNGQVVYMPRSQAAGMTPPAPAALRTQADAMKSVGSALSAIKQFSDSVNTSSGPVARVSGAVRSGLGAVGLDPQTKVFEDTRKAHAIRLSRALGEVGVLTNQDIERAVSLIPGPGTTKEEAAMKFQQLEGILNASLSAKGLPPIHIEDLTPGTPVDGSVPSKKPISNRLQELLNR